LSLDRKNKINLWQEVIELEFMQITDYETFIVLDSVEDVPKGYQKIPYHILFDVIYDLRHKARLVAGSNWTVNDKEGFSWENSTDCHAMHMKLEINF
jgi:hypothetical protein